MKVREVDYRVVPAMGRELAMRVAVFSQSMELCNLACLIFAEPKSEEECRLLSLAMSARRNTYRAIRCVVLGFTRKMAGDVKRGNELLATADELHSELRNLSLELRRQMSEPDAGKEGA